MRKIQSNIFLNFGFKLTAHNDSIGKYSVYNETGLTLGAQRFFGTCLNAGPKVITDIYTLLSAIPEIE